MSDLVLVSREDGVLTLTLNRPSRKNAINLEMYEAMSDALEGAAGDPSVRVVLVRAEGDAFCGGNDLADFMKNPPTEDESPVMRFLLNLLTFPKPLVAAVHGAAVGIGTTMLLHCDLAWCSDDAFFKMPFVTLGIVPEAGSTLLVPGLVGHRKATELLTLGERFGPAEAERYGFVNGVVPRASLDDTARAAARKMAALPPEAVRLTKALLRAPDAERLAAVVRKEGDTFMARLSSPETLEAITAFFERRAPDFSRFS